MTKQLCVTTQLARSQGGGAGKVAFIDTEGTFRIVRDIRTYSNNNNINDFKISFIFLQKRVAEIAETRYGLVRW